MKRLPLLVVVILISSMTAAAQNPPRPGPIVSPELQSGGEVTFRLRAPQAKEVVLRGQWSKEPLPLTRGAEGVWSATVAMPSC